MLHGFVMFVVDDEEKVVRVDDAFTPDRLGLAMLRLLREWAWVVAEDARTLRLLELGGAWPEVDRGRVGRLRAAVAADPENVVREVLMAGVAVDAAEDLSQSRETLWGYVLDFDVWGFEVYEGWQTTSHTDGRFFERARGVTSYPPRLAAIFGMSDAHSAARALPSDEEFLAAVREGARTLECAWPGR